MRALLAPRTLRNSSPVPLAARSAAWATRYVNRHDTRAQMATYESVSTLHAIVNSISTSVAAVRWHLYKTHRSGDPSKRKEVTKHPALQVWNRPNPHQTRMQFVRAQQQHLELAGEADWIVSRPAGMTIPSELWLVRPDRMAPVPHPTDFLSGWVYTSPDGEQVPLEVNEVLQPKYPNPMDPYRGLSPVPSAMIDLEAAQLAAQWNLNFFYNSAEPGGVIEVPRSLTDPEFKTMRERWAETHKGVANAHRVAILENGKWVPRGYSMRDMEFVGLRGLSSEIIREAFAYPKPMLGGTEDVNKAAAWAAQVIMARWLVAPRLEILREILNVFFLPMFGSLADGHEFDFENPVPEDREDDDRERTSKSTAVTQLVAAGAYLPDVLEAYELPAMRRTVDVDAEAAADPDEADEPAVEEPADPDDAPPAPDNDPDEADQPDEPATEQVAAMLRRARDAAERLLR